MSPISLQRSLVVEMKMAKDYREISRQATLDLIGILDTPAEWQYDCLTALATYIFDAPMSALSLVDRDRQWFKSKIGLDVDETEREISFCTKVIEGSNPMVVEDATLDPRFCNSPLVTEHPKIKFYAGAPIVVHGEKLGSLCVMDRRTQKATKDQENALHILAEIASAFMMYGSEIDRLTDIIRNLSEQVEKLESAA